MNPKEKARPTVGAMGTGKDVRHQKHIQREPDRQPRRFRAHSLSPREENSLRRLQWDWLIAVERGESSRADRIYELIKRVLPPEVPRRKGAVCA